MQMTPDELAELGVGVARSKFEQMALEIKHMIFKQAIGRPLLVFSEDFSSNMPGSIITVRRNNSCNLIKAAPEHQNHNIQASYDQGIISFRRPLQMLRFFLANDIQFVTPEAATTFERRRVQAVCIHLDYYTIWLDHSGPAKPVWWAFGAALKSWKNAFGRLAGQQSQGALVFDLKTVIFYMKPIPSHVAGLRSVWQMELMLQDACTTMNTLFDGSVDFHVANCKNTRTRT